MYMFNRREGERGAYALLYNAAVLAFPRTARSPRRFLLCEIPFSIIINRGSRSIGAHSAVHIIKREGLKYGSTFPYTGLSQPIAEMMDHDAAERSACRSASHRYIVLFRRVLAVTNSSRRPAAALGQLISYMERERERL